MKLTVNLGSTGYPIFIDFGILKQVKEYVSQIFHGNRIMVISDDHVFPLYGKLVMECLSSYYQCHSFILPHGEASKSFQSLPHIYSALLESNMTRSDLIIALGGGVIGDLAGFVASTYLRGISLVQIPTSLLAQVDSSVGGKVGVDLPQGKNLVGAFHQPDLVLIDLDVLDTLPLRYITDGMGEVIKYSCIQDASLFKILNAHTSFHDLKEHLPLIISRCVDIKRLIVEKDQFDTGERMLLNFGHTLGHAIEQYYNYKRESHGEAIAIGMYQITKLSETLRLTQPGESQRIRQMLQTYGLPVKCDLPISSLINAIKVDKKNLDEKLNVILLHNIGNSYIYPTTADFFHNTHLLSALE